MTLRVRIDSLHPPARASAAVLRHLSLEVAPGEVVTLMGPSGCGKSSVLAAIAGTLVHEDASADTAEGLCYRGCITLQGQDITHWPTQRRGIGLLFQDDLLFAHMTVLDNLLFAVPSGERNQRRRPQERMAQAEAALAEAGLAGMGARDPATLSGGQRARVAMMRALLAEPRVLLLDEPFSRLDAGLRAQFRAFVFGHLRARSVAAVLVTHDAADIPAHSTVLHLEGAHAR